MNQDTTTTTQHPTIKPKYEYVDPFAGVTRLNQLSEREVLLRNERMSNPTLQRQYPNKTEEEMNQLSREFYRQNTLNCIQAPQTEAERSKYELPFGWGERHNTVTSIGDLSTAALDPNAPRLARDHQKESSCATKCGMSGCSDDAARLAQFVDPPPQQEQQQKDIPTTNNTPAQQANNDNLMKLFHEAMEETKKVQYEVAAALEALKKAKQSGDAVDVEIAMEEYKLKREMFTHAQNKETNLLQLLGGR